jgi:hypothetical protein
MIKSHSELSCLETFEERYEYLRLGGVVGNATFGFDRHLNQSFYRSSEWKHIRRQVIIRDDGCDLGLAGFEIHSELLVHHMNPLTTQDVERGEYNIMNAEFLITTTHDTHNAIHYGDKNLLRKPYVERTPNDTKLW